MSGDFDVRVGAYAVIVRDGRILLAHWNQGGHSGWTLPGGGLELLEDAPTAAVREVFEETGYHVRLDGLLGVDSHFIPPERRMHGTRTLHGLRVLYRAEIVGGSLTTEVDGTTDGAAWFDLADVPALDTVGLVDVGLRLHAAGPVDR